MTRPHFPVSWDQPSFRLFYLLGHVRFIDYEYAGYNYQAFDIGNHFNEFAGEKGIHYHLVLVQVTFLMKEGQVHGEEGRGLCPCWVEA